MLRTGSRSKHEQAYVKLGTMRDMSTVARKMAAARQAIREIEKIEGMLGDWGDDRRFRGRMQDIADLAVVVRHETKDSITILRSIKTDVEAYLRDLRRVLAS
jgi:hypothetical protein